MISIELKKESWLYVVTFFLVLIVLGFYLNVREFNLTIPLVYEKDGLFAGVGIKSIIDTGWYLTNSSLGYPNGYQLYDYPLSDNFSFLAIKLLSFFSHNYAVIMNLFYLLTFPLIAWTSLFVFRKLKIEKSFAVIAALLFTFLPYHLMRGELHLFLSAYYVVPLYLLVIFSICSQEIWPRRKILLYSLLLIIAASSGIYYAFFACYFLFIAGMIAAFDQQNWKPLIKSLLAIAIIATTCFVNLNSYFNYVKQNGTNTVVALRSAGESEDVGLRITQMLLPVDGHRVKLLRKLKEKYNTTVFSVNENRSATLGLIGSVGFIILLGMLFVRRESVFKSHLFYLSCLTLSGTLLGTMGGFGTLFAYTISSSIRSYNRISVFIAFFAIAGFFLALQLFLKKLSLTKQKNYTYLLAAILLMVGVYDQIGYGLRPNYSATSARFLEDQRFVEKIESILPAHASIFQLPVTNFPENAVVYNMRDYELFRGYLHSHQINWSYGAVKGRSLFSWQQHISQLPLETMLAELKQKGFSGLYINRSGYPDKAIDLERKLTLLLNQKPVMDNHREIIFYDLSNYEPKTSRVSALSIIN